MPIVERGVPGPRRDAGPTRIVIRAGLVADGAAQSCDPRAGGAIGSNTSLATWRLTPAIASAWAIGHRFLLDAVDEQPPTEHRQRRLTTRHESLITVWLGDPEP